MKCIKINNNLNISDNINYDILFSLKNEGFSTIINLNPDEEYPEKPEDKLEYKTVKKYGLDYYFIPINLKNITRADICAFQAALEASRGKVFAYCRSRIHALTLYVLGESLKGRMHPKEIESFGRSHGFNLNEAATWLERNSRSCPVVEGFFDPGTWSVQYVVTDPKTKKCAVIDPVLDYDEKSGSINTRNADILLAYIERNGLSLEWILDTHPHADHFSAAFYLKEKTGAPMAIGTHVKEVQKFWKIIYNMPELATDGSQWDRLFEAGDTFKIGNLQGRVLSSPGHTLASVSYVIGDAVFVHDTIFMPDSGTARTDFPGGSAKVLWESIQEILALPDETRLFTGHDYQTGGRHPRWESTVAEQKRNNLHLAGIDETRFISLREKRDKTLPMPKLILHALQVNTHGGRLPKAESNGTHYLKIPLNALENAVW